nr:MAG TPA: hypothetical protein [Caudoviricetes sp.]
MTVVQHVWRLMRVVFCSAGITRLSGEVTSYGLLER